MNRSLPTWIELAVLAYCGWQARDLDWMSTPAVRWGGLAFVLWCLPVLWNQTLAIRSEQVKGYTMPLLLLAVICSLVGSLGSLRVLTHVGLALALAGILPFSAAQLIWLATAVAWMPAFGWLARSLALGTIHLLQFGIVAVGTGVLLAWQSTQRR